MKVYDTVEICDDIGKYTNPLTQVTERHRLITHKQISLITVFSYILARDTKRFLFVIARYILKTCSCHDITTQRVIDIIFL